MQTLGTFHKNIFSLFMGSRTKDLNIEAARGLKGENSFFT